MDNFDQEISFVNDKQKLPSFNCLMAEDCLTHFTGQQYLIVTADDFGYDARRDKGIIECFTKGIVTRASLLVNGCSARTTAVELARKNNMPLGIHLNLTEGEPICDGNSSLTGENSRFFRGKFGLRDALKREEIGMNDVKNEVIAQIKTFIQFAGFLPNHVDGHQHIHILPGIREVIAEVMHTYSLCQVRIPLEDNLPVWFQLNRTFYNSIFQDAKSAMEVYGKYRIRFPHKFIGISLMGKYMSAERLIEATERTSYGQSHSISICELMVHPGDACVKGIGGCGSGPDDFACSPEREHEASILRHPELKKLLHEKGVTLIS